MFEQYLPQFKRTGLFERLPDEDIIGLMPCFNAYEMSCGKGDILFQAGDPQTTVGIVVRVRFISEGGLCREPLSCQRALGGDMFGEVSAFANWIVGPIQFWPVMIVQLFLSRSNESASPAVESVLLIRFSSRICLRSWHVRRFI